MDDGYIKFQIKWKEEPFRDAFEIDELNRWLEFLKKENLIGVYPDGIGFGNISERCESGFLITGTQTAELEVLHKRHYTLVEDYNIAENRITCIGGTKASSESLTHAAIYEASMATNAIVHVHSKYLWDKYLNVLPTTKDVAYGTPEIALEIKRLVQEAGDEGKIIIMAGHEEGVIAYGSSLKSACLSLMTL